MGIVGLAPGKEESALLCHATTRQMAMRFDPVPAPAQCGDQGANLNAFEVDIIVRRLIRDHDVEVGESLPKKTGQDDRKSGLAAARRNKHVNESHSPIHL